MLNEEIEIAHEIRLDLMDPAAETFVSLYARVASQVKDSDSFAHWIKITFLHADVAHLVQTLNNV